MHLQSALARPKLPQTIGLAGLYTFSFGAWLGIALANLGLLLMLIGLLIDWRRVFTAWRSSYWTWLVLVSLLTLALSAWQGMSVDHDTPLRHGKEARRLAMLWLFLLLAWWLAGDTRRIATALILAAAGFVIGRLSALDQDGQLMILNLGYRPGFGLPTLAFAQYTATLLISLCLVGPRLQALKLAHAPVRLLLLLAWLSAIALSLAGLLLAEARMVWIATAAVLVPAIAVLLVGREQNPSGRAKTATQGRMFALVAILMLAVAALNFNIVSERITTEREALDSLLSKDVAQTGYGSVGLRVHAWIYAVELMETHPWLGWGPAASRALLASHPEPRMHVIPDFHNTPLEFLVTVGLLGSIPFALAFCIVVVMLLRAFRHGRLPLDLFLIVLAALALHQLAGLTNSRILNPDWAHLWLLFGGAAASFTTQQRNRNRTVTGT